MKETHNDESTLFCIAVSLFTLLQSASVVGYQLVFISIRFLKSEKHNMVCRWSAVVQFWRTCPKFF